MLAQQSLYIYNPYTQTREWMSMDAYESWYATLTPEQQAKADRELSLAVDPSMEAWADDEIEENKGLYWRKTEDEEEILPPPPPPPPPPPLFSLIYTGQAGCVNPASGEIKVENREFMVASGEPIPTSESLRIEGHTDLLGQVQNIQNWQLVINRNEVYTANAEWHWGYGRSVSHSWSKKSGDDWIDGSSSWTDEWAKNKSAPTYSESDSDTYKESYSYGSTYDVNKTVSAESAPTIPSPGKQGYTVTHDANVIKTEAASATNEVLGGKVVVPIPAPKLTMSGQSDKAGDDESRVSYGFSYTLPGVYSTESAAQTAVNNYVKGPLMKDYWGVETDGPVTVSAEGGGSNSYSANCPVLAGEMGTDDIKFNELAIEKIDPEKIENKSIGDEYPTTEGTIIVGGMDILILPEESLNPVKVHTPIFNELKVEPSTKNQLENFTLASGAPVVTLGGEAKITVNIKGPESKYYNDDIAIQLDDLSKYVKKVELICGLCGEYLVYERGVKNTFDSSTASSFVHNCQVNDNRKDNELHSVMSRVTAENIEPADSPTKQTSLRYNIPDNEYIVERTSGVYVAGKMYDLQVRATDDPGWKDFVKYKDKQNRDKQAQDLSKLPVGEKGDNANGAWKYGIKLGYRAFFDLKTLGVATDSVKIIPKIYFVDVNGNVINDVDIWYRNSPTTYKQLTNNGTILSTNDIGISMTMNTTNGEKYNPVYNEEKLKTLKQMNTAINYAKLDNLGGLYQITLDSVGATANALMTKYNGAYQTKVYSMIDGHLTEETNYNHSRRWYGEVFIPSSTIVAKDNTPVEQLARGINTYTKGYLLVTFDTIETTVNGTTQYLKYSTAHTPTGSDSTPYILTDEKSGKGSTTPITLSNGTTVPPVPITLPNGNKIKLEGLGGTTFYENSAPIVIYDISLRANNDYTPSGTH